MTEMITLLSIVLSLVIAGCAGVQVRRCWRRRSSATLVMDAAREGNAEIVRELIAHGADVNAKDTLGWTTTALTLAARNGHAEVVRELESAGAKD